MRPIPVCVGTPRRKLQQATLGEACPAHRRRALQPLLLDQVQRTGPPPRKGLVEGGTGHVIRQRNVGQDNLEPASESIR